MAAESEQAREEIKRRIQSAIKEDPRVAACLDYGASGHGRGDQWSDLDLALFIRDQDMAGFELDWQSWAGQFGDLLLATISFAGNPWAVYDTGATPLRVDFSFKPQSSIPDLTGLLLSPLSTEEMILYDDTGGTLHTAVSQLLGKSLQPPDPYAAFSRACGDFWIILLRCHARLLREQFWSARHDFHILVLPNLLALLRLRYGAATKWLASNPADGIEAVLDQEVLARLKRCLPDRDDRDLHRALRETAGFGAETCSQLNETFGWEWPEKLAQKTRALFSPGAAELNALSPLYLKPIGIVQNNIEELLPPHEIKSVPSRIIIDPVLSAGLDGLEGNQRLLVVFQFHRLAGYELHQHPKNNPQLSKKGVFALHSPKRPNPIGVTEVDLLRREGNILHVRGLDAVNGTPVLDLKLNS